MKVINIADYVHSIGLRISDAQMNKIRESGLDVSEFVRRSIDGYDLSIDEIVETKLKDMLEDVESEFVKQQDELKENIVKQLLNNKQSFDDYIVQQFNNCKTNRDVKEGNCSTNHDTQKDNSNHEGLFLQILPTLQGMYHSEQALTDEKLRFQANRIGVKTSELKAWIARNGKLLEGDDYLYR